LKPFSRRCSAARCCPQTGDMTPDLTLSAKISDAHCRGAAKTCDPRRCQVATAHYVARHLWARPHNRFESIEFADVEAVRDPRGAPPDRHTVLSLSA